MTRYYTLRLTEKEIDALWMAIEYIQAGPTDDPFLESGKGRSALQRVREKILRAGDK